MPDLRWRRDTVPLRVVRRCARARDAHGNHALGFRADGRGDAGHCCKRKMPPATDQGTLNGAGTGWHQEDRDRPEQDRCDQPERGAGQLPRDQGVRQGNDRRECPDHPGIVPERDQHGRTGRGTPPGDP